MEIIRCKNLTQKLSERRKKRIRIERKTKRKKEKKLTILFHVTKCRI